MVDRHSAGGQSGDAGGGSIVCFGQYLARRAWPEHECGGDDGCSDLGLGADRQACELGVSGVRSQACLGLVLVVSVFCLLSGAVGFAAPVVRHGLATGGIVGGSGSGFGVLGGLVGLACLRELLPGARGPGIREHAAFPGGRGCGLVRDCAGLGRGRVCVGALSRLADSAGLPDADRHLGSGLAAPGELALALDAAHRTGLRGTGRHAHAGVVVAGFAGRDCRAVADRVSGPALDGAGGLCRALASRQGPDQSGDDV